LSENSYELAIPPADALIESLRAFGYTPETAVADLIDNSITAGARNVWLTFEWEGDGSCVVIKDDGRGMSEGELSQAMRPASRHPKEEREHGDLGRFGLGLKTASFSQCRSLTVSSKTAGSKKSIRRWDLDYVNETKEWRLLLNGTGRQIDAQNYLEHQTQGTVVVWEKLDRWSETDIADRAAEDAFLEMIRQIENHLAMVFHRFLQNPRRFAIWIGSRRLEPWDPFLSGEPSTQMLSAEVLSIFGRQVEVKPYILPHQSRLSPEMHARAAGPRGWNGQQGFYIYRSNRMLVDGDWLGFFKQEEHCKLARISVDIDNLMDVEWEIDVRKSIARPPDGVRGNLRRIAQVTRERAVRVYRHRGSLGQRQSQVDHLESWVRRQAADGTVRYQVNRNHPLVAALLTESDVGSQIRALIRILEETVPVQQIWIDSAERGAESPLPFFGARDQEILDIMRQVLSALFLKGYAEEEAMEHLASMPAFVNSMHLVQVLREEQTQE
jgi:hypothetical protein